MDNLALIHAELRALGDDALFARTREIIRLGYDGKDANGLLTAPGGTRRGV